MSPPKKTKELSYNAKKLLESMRNGGNVLYRGTVGSAEMKFENGRTSYEVFPSLLLELKRAGLIRIKSADEQTAWIVYEACKE
jgi:hypothetical protein